MLNSTTPVVNYHYVEGEGCGNDDRAKQIYEKVIAELVKECPNESLDRLLLNICDSLIAFNVTLRYTGNVNAKDAKGQSFLHVTKSYEVAELLIKMCLDVDVLDFKDWTTLMAQVNANRSKVVKSLLHAGGKSDFVNEKGPSLFTSSLDKNAFLKSFNLTEKMFRAAVARGSGLTCKLLEGIFQEYPSYQEAFESNSPLHLAVLKNCYNSDYIQDLLEQG